MPKQKAAKAQLGTDSPTPINVKEEPLEQGAMDSVFEASFTMPGEI